MRPRPFSLVIVGYLCSAVFTVVLAVLAVGDKTTSQVFWTRTAWVEFLVLCSWALPLLASSGLLTRTSARFQGIYPGLMLAVLAYVSLSFLLLMVHMFVPVDRFPDRFHLFGQVARAAVIVLIGIGMVSAAVQVQDVHQHASSSDLVSRLRHEEARFRLNGEPWPDSVQAGELLSGLKALREAMTFSLPQTREVSAHEGYQRLRTDVAELCDSLETLRPDLPDVGRRVNDHLRRAKDLRRDVRLISDTFVKR